MRPAMSQENTAAAAAEVISRRLPIMWQHMLQPTAKGHGEMLGMLTEKPAAFYEGLLRMQLQVGVELMRMWAWPLQPQAGNPAARIADALTAPAREQLAANRTRLRRR